MRHNILSIYNTKGASSSAAKHCVRARTTPTYCRVAYSSARVSSLRTPVHYGSFVNTHACLAFRSLGCAFAREIVCVCAPSCCLREFPSVAHTHTASWKIRVYARLDVGPQRSHTASFGVQSLVNRARVTVVGHVCASVSHGDI